MESVIVSAPSNRADANPEASPATQVPADGTVWIDTHLFPA